MFQNLKEVYSNNDCNTFCNTSVTQDVSPVALPVVLWFAHLLEFKMAQTLDISLVVSSCINQPAIKNIIILCDLAIFPCNSPVESPKSISIV